MKNGLLTFIIMLLFIACNSTIEKSTVPDDLTPASDQIEEKKATFVHTVFFWMKEDLSKEEAQFFEKEMEILGSKTPSILNYKWGKPAGTPRDVVDNSYTYAWIVDFESKEDQDTYQDDPAHLEFIEKCKDLWTRVQVYDTVLD